MTNQMNEVHGRVQARQRNHARGGRHFMSEARKEKKYWSWLEKCQSIAMSSEWIIDVDALEWRTWFTEGLTPDEAVAKLFKGIREGTR